MSRETYEEVLKMLGPQRKITVLLKEDVEDFEDLGTVLRWPGNIRCFRCDNDITDVITSHGKYACQGCRSMFKVEYHPPITFISAR